LDDRVQTVHGRLHRAENEDRDEHRSGGQRRSDPALARVSENQSEGKSHDAFVAAKAPFSS
jgi:hypothetical protein